MEKTLMLEQNSLDPLQLSGQVVGTNRLAQIVDGGGSVTYMKWGGDNSKDTEGMKEYTLM